MENNEKRNDNSRYIKELQHIKEPSKYRLGELKEMVGYEGTMPCFRALCWRLKIDYKRSTRTEIIKRIVEAANKFDFAKMTLTEIKQATGYKGGIHNLQNILLKEGIKFAKKKKVNKELKEQVLSRIHLIDDTRKYKPKAIFDKLGIQVVNPSTFLRRLNIPYKPR